MKLKLILFLSMTSPLLHADWSIGTKADISRSTTDNVDATKTSTKKDSYNVLNAYIQTKNDTNRIRLRGKFTRYAEYTENDSNYLDLSYQLKFQKNKEMTLTYFNEKYTGTPTSSTDITGDNNGGKISVYLADQFNKETLGYFNLTFTSKKYTKETRTDSKPEISTGLEFQAGKDVVLIPDLSFGYNKSSQDYYTVTTWGPSITAIVTLSDNFEFSTGYSVTKSNYKNRELQKQFVIDHKH